MSFSLKNPAAALIVCGSMRALLSYFDSLTGGAFPDNCKSSLSRVA